MEKNKNLEYYLDSRIYSTEEIEKSIEETKKEFPNKNVKVNTNINDFGMYIITFTFENKNTFFNRIVIKIWKKLKRSRMIGNGERNNYGQYKKTKTYRPY